MPSAIGDGDRRRLNTALVSNTVRNSISFWRTLRRNSSVARLRLKPEEKLTIECADFLRLTLPRGALVLHVPSEAKRSRAGWAVQQAMGYINGVPDHLILARGEMFFIEYKTGKNGLTAAQIDFGIWAEDQGYRFAVVRSLDQLEKTAREWGIVN